MLYEDGTHSVSSELRVRIIGYMLLNPQHVCLDIRSKERIFLDCNGEETSSEIWVVGNIVKLPVTLFVSHKFRRETLKSYVVIPAPPSTIGNALRHSGVPNIPFCFSPLRDTVYM